MIAFDQPAWYYALAALVCVLGVARLTRLVTQDTYPPMQALRDWWRKITKDGDWSELIECPFCAAPYLAAASLAWAAFTDLQPAWWVVHVWLAVSYLASMIVAQDT